MYQSSAEACNIMFTVHCVSVQWIVISLAPQSLSLRHVKAQFSAAANDSKSFVLAEWLASGLCLPRALTAAPLDLCSLLVSFTARELPEG